MRLKERMSEEGKQKSKREGGKIKAERREGEEARQLALADRAGHWGPF